MSLSGRAVLCALRVSRTTRTRAVHSTRAAWAPGDPPPKAAALVIGNEVLSGKIQDTNTVWLGALLNRA
jgi:hypothetical protein